jgi:uncharacterized membrane protein YbaN (DUF454 family)
MTARKPDETEEHHVHIPDLPLGIRIALLIVGWLVVILGLAGLLLPGLQGILLLMLGAAILSVASDTAHRNLEKLLERRPRIRERLNDLRSKLHNRLGR